MHKGAKVAGLILIGGSDSVLNGVYVKKLIPDSPAHVDGRLRPADQILRINSVSMEQANHNTALQALQKSSSTLCLTVYRDPELGQALIKTDNGMCMYVCRAAYRKQIRRGKNDFLTLAMRESKRPFQCVGKNIFKTAYISVTMWY